MIINLDRTEVSLREENCRYCNKKAPYGVEISGKQDAICDVSTSCFCNYFPISPSGQFTLCQTIDWAFCGRSIKDTSCTWLSFPLVQ
jgi:hypothetical protein